MDQKCCAFIPVVTDNHIATSIQPLESGSKTLAAETPPRDGAQPKMSMMSFLASIDRIQHMVPTNRTPTKIFSGVMLEIEPESVETT